MKFVPSKRKKHLPIRIDRYYWIVGICHWEALVRLRRSDPEYLLLHHIWGSFLIFYGRQLRAMLDGIIAEIGRSRIASIMIGPFVGGGGEGEDETICYKVLMFSPNRCRGGFPSQKRTFGVWGGVRNIVLKHN